MKSARGPARSSWPCISEDGTTYEEKCGSKMNWNENRVPRGINNTKACTPPTKFARCAIKYFAKRLRWRSQCRAGRIFCVRFLEQQAAGIAFQGVRDKILFGVSFQTADCIFRASKCLKRWFAHVTLIRSCYDISCSTQNDSLRGEPFQLSH